MVELHIIHDGAAFSDVLEAQGAEIPFGDFHAGVSHEARQSVDVPILKQIFYGKCMPKFMRVSVELPIFGEVHKDLVKANQRKWLITTPDEDIGVLLCFWPISIDVESEGLCCFYPNR